MAEFDKRSDWISIVSNLKKSISSCGWLELKLVWLCELMIITALLAAIQRGNNPREHKGNWVLTQRECTYMICDTLGVSMLDTVGRLFNYRNTYCHKGYEANVDLYKINVHDLCTLFERVGVQSGVTEEEWIMFFNMPTLKQMQRTVAYN